MTSDSTTKSTASPVRCGHVPNWFRLRLLKAFGCQDRRTDGHSVIHHAAYRVWEMLKRRGEDSDLVVWLDHWGSTRIDGAVYFVSEPYASYPPNPRELAVADYMAYRTNCRLRILPDAAWNPAGGTIRLLFIPNEDDQ